MRPVLVFLALLLLPASASAGTLTVNDNTVTFTAAPGEANVVTYDSTGSGDSSALVITDTGAPLAPPAGCTAVIDNAVSCPSPGNLKVALGDGDDAFAPADKKNAPFVDLEVDAGRGDDDVVVGGYHQNTNKLDGGPGADTVVADEAEDTVIDGDTDPDTLDGGKDTFDTLSYAPQTAGVTVDLTADGPGPDGGTVAGFDDLIGGKGDDTLTGTEDVAGGPGNDTLRHGPDAAFGILRGGPGDDDLTTSESARGQAGDDALHGLGKDPTLRGDAGNDTFDGERGGRFRGLGGQDEYVCGPKKETIVYPDPGEILGEACDEVYFNLFNRARFTQVFAPNPVRVKQGNPVFVVGCLQDGDYESPEKAESCEGKLVIREVGGQERKLGEGVLDGTGLDFPTTVTLNKLGRKLAAKGVDVTVTTIERGKRYRGKVRPFSWSIRLKV